MNKKVIIIILVLAIIGIILYFVLKKPKTETATATESEPIVYDDEAIAEYDEFLDNPFPVDESGWSS